MSTVYLVTGGARSGKSGYAQKLCEYLSPDPTYLATAHASKSINNDADFARRIAKHQQDRGDQWTTIEEGLQPSVHLSTFKGRVVLVDCLTLWLTNYMLQEGLFSLDEKNDEDGHDDNKEEQQTIVAPDSEVQDASERALTKIQQEFDKLIEPWNCTYVFVTNELGSGTHPHDHVSRKFVDAQGWFNQYVAKKAQIVIHMVCGYPNILKEPSAAGSSVNTTYLTSLAARNNDNNTAVAARADMLNHYLSKRSIKMDPSGYFKIKVDTSTSSNKNSSPEHNNKVIRATYHSCIINEQGHFFDLDGNRLTCHGKSPEPIMVWEARTAKELTMQILEQWEKASEVVSVGHAAYIGREAQKAELALYGDQRTTYRQD